MSHRARDNSTLSTESVAEVLLAPVAHLNRLFHATELLVPPSGVEWSRPIAEYIQEADREDYDNGGGGDYDTGRINFFRIQYENGADVDPPELSISDQRDHLTIDGMHRLAGAVLAEKKFIPIIVRAANTTLLNRAIKLLAINKGRRRP